MFLFREGNKETAKTSGERALAAADDSSEVRLRLEAKSNSGGDNACDKGGDSDVARMLVEVDRDCEAME